MRRFRWVALVCVLACGRVDFAFTPDAATLTPQRWNLIQVAGAGSGSSPQDFVTIAPTTEHSLLVVAVEVQNATSPVTSVIDNAGNTYQAIPNTIATDSVGVSLRLELWYAPDAKSNATTVTATGSVTPVAVVVWEVANVALANPLDTAVPASDQPDSTVAFAPPITTTEPGELVLAAVIVRYRATQIHASTGFTNDTFTHDNAFAHLTDDAAPVGEYQAVWDVDTSGSYCGVSAAFRARPSQ